MSRAWPGPNHKKSTKSLGRPGILRPRPNLHSAASIVLKEHRGVIPDHGNEFRKLPGVGDYIAAAVLSLAFEKPYPVVDGNVKRV